jgi:hypothetical protein
MMGGETTRNMKNIDNNKEYCVILHLVGCIEKNTLTMYGHMEVTFNTVYINWLLQKAAVYLHAYHLPMYDTLLVSL